MRLLTGLFLVVLSFSCFAKPIQIVDMHLWKLAQHNTRLIFDLNAPVTHNIFTLKSPHRLVIDLKNTQLVKRLIYSPKHDTLVKNIRSIPLYKDNLRVILDLKGSAHAKSSLLKPDKDNGHRLVVDINTFKPTALLSASQHIPYLKSHKRKLVIAIDAGHGGIDSGAIGAKGTKEKDVVLAIAKELAALVMKESNMRPVLIRKNDYFIKLRQRIELARQHKANLFISIHADAYPHDTNVRGSSVYVLSRRGASSEQAKWIAEKENSADLIGGISLSDKNDLLASVLFDLSLHRTLEASTYVGQRVLKSLKKIGKNHFTRVQRANFMVLRSPDIPSILVETAFISNPAEEKKLNNRRYRRQMAVAIMKGIRAYFKQFKPQATALLARR